MRHRTVGTLALLVALAAAPLAARADSSCEVLLIRASHGAGGIDLRLREIRQLSQPPLSLFREMRLLEKKELTLSVGAEARATLSNGWTLRLRDAGVSPEGTRYEAVVQRPGGPDRIRFTAAAGAPFFTVIQRGQEAFILGFTCR
jgi:hypothetical protein